MIFRLLLAVLGLGLVVAQQEYLLYTNGPGGVKCGKLHRCIEKATCEDKSGVRMCECPESSLNGNAKLQCLPGEDHNLWIQNDPHLKNLHKEFAGLSSPCPFRVLNLLFVPEVDTRVKLELYAQNTLFKEGHYFLTKLTLSTTVYLANDMMRQIMEFEGDIITDINSGVYNYTLVARSLDTSLFDQPAGIDNIVTIDDSRFVDYTMAVDKDAMDNLLTVEIKGLGVKLFFRPPSMDEEINNIELPMVPGAVLNVKRESWKMVDLTKSEFDVASFPQGPSLKEKATEHKVSKPVYIQHLLLKDSTDKIGYNDTICSRSHEIYTKECVNQKRQWSMLQSCSSIYADQTFLKCLTEKHSMDEYIPMHKQFFQTCASVLCTKNTGECNKMKSEMPQITGCPLPKKVETIDCSSIN